MSNVFPLKETGGSVNQGVLGAAMRLYRWRALLLTPLDYALTPADLASPATLKAKLQADAIADDPADRIYLVSLFGEAADNSPEPRRQTWGYGMEQFLYGSQYSMRLFPETADLLRFQKMQQFNGRASEFLAYVIDEYYNIGGTKGAEADGDVTFRGGTLHDYLAHNVKFDAGEGAKQAIDVAFADATEFNNGNLMVFPAGFNVWTQLKNVADVTLNQMSSLASGVVSVAPIVGSGVIGANLATKYPTVLADADLWVAKNVATGALLTISSIAKATVSGVDVFTFTFSTSSPYPAATGKISIELAAISDVVDAGVIPAEVPDPLILTV